MRKSMFGLLAILSLLIIASVAHAEPASTHQARVKTYMSVGYNFAAVYALDAYGAESVKGKAVHSDAEIGKFVRSLPVEQQKLLADTSVKLADGYVLTDGRRYALISKGAAGIAAEGTVDLKSEYAVIFAATLRDYLNCEITLKNRKVIVTKTKDLKASFTSAEPETHFHQFFAFGQAPSVEEMARALCYLSAFEVQIAEAFASEQQPSCKKSL